MWGNPVERVHRLRSRHVIRPSTMQVGIRCEVDGIRIHPTKVGWRHDTAEIVTLNAEAARVIRPSEVHA